MTIPSAEVNYRQLGGAKPDAARDELYDRVNAELDRLDAARLDGRPVTTISAWQRAFDRIADRLSTLTVIARALFEAASGSGPALTRTQLDTLHREHVTAVEAINATLGAFTEPDAASSHWQWLLASDLPTSEAESAALDRNLVIVRNIHQLAAQICGDRRDLARLKAELHRQVNRLTPGTRGSGSASFAARFHMPIVVEIDRELTAALEKWKSTTRRQFPYVWDERLEPNLVERRGRRAKAGKREREGYFPGPAEVARRLIAERTEYSWVTVKRAIHRAAPGAERPEEVLPPGGTRVSRTGPNPLKP